MDRNEQKVEVRRPCAAYCLLPTASWKKGFTLPEVMVTAVVVAILASIAIPSYTKAIERGYLQEAKDLLLTIYYGEQAYFSANKTYHDPDAVGGSWRTIFMENPNLGSSPPVGFTVSATSTTFTATATRNGGPCPSGNRTLTVTAANRTPSGSWLECPSL